jgi:hypothetical protein
MHTIDVTDWKPRIDYTNYTSITNRHHCEYQLQSILPWHSAIGIHNAPNVHGMCSEPANEYDYE